MRHLARQVVPGLSSSTATPHRAWGGPWTPTLSATEDHNVYARWGYSTGNRATNSPFTIHHGNGTTALAVNQNCCNAQWIKLGAFPMAPASSHKVVLTDQANNWVTADVAAFESIDAALNKAIWTPPITAAGPHFLWVWKAGNANAAPYTIYHSGGATTLIRNQANFAAGFNLMGTFDFAPGQNHRIELTDRNAGQLGFDLGADAIAIDPVTGIGNLATWTPLVTVRDRYKVYVIWSSSATRASNARYIVTHEGGTTSYVRDQRSGGGVWQYLGTHGFTPGAGHKIQLSDRADGVVDRDGALHPRGTHGIADV